MGPGVGRGEGGVGELRVGELGEGLGTRLLNRRQARVSTYLERPGMNFLAYCSGIVRYS